MSHETISVSPYGDLIVYANEMDFVERVDFPKPFLAFIASKWSMDALDGIYLVFFSSLYQFTRYFSFLHFQAIRKKLLGICDLKTIVASLLNVSFFAVILMCIFFSQLF